MKKIIAAVLVVFTTSFASFAGSIILEGNYQGKNLYIQNPFAGSGVGFCTYEVRINGRVTTDEISSSAFEIDFTAFMLKIGEKVEVEIRHKDDCKPKVLNAEVLKPQSTYEIVPGSMIVKKDGTLEWSTKNEVGKLPFIVEQFRWNKWVRVGELEGKGRPEQTTYRATVYPHSGENKFRVKQIDFKGPKYSEAVKYTSEDPVITFAPIKVDKEIMFSDNTMYEIYDMYANIVKRGFGEKVDASSLQKGAYFINYDNKIGDKFIKK